MSVGYKKKDKDKDAKGASGVEASANYMIGSGGQGKERSPNTTGLQELGSAIAADKLSTREDISTTRRMTSSSSSPPSQDQISTESMMATTAAASSSTTSTSNDAPYQYQYQQNYQQQIILLMGFRIMTRKGLRKYTDN